jgi:ATP-dependent Clp protease adapter protein ClpS
MSKTIVKPSETIGNPKIANVTLEDRSDMSNWAVEAFNNDISTFEDVIKVFTKVCMYDRKTAETYTRRIHTEGRVVCFGGTKARCELVIAAFKNILVKAILLER